MYAKLTPAEQQASDRLRIILGRELSLAELRAFVAGEHIKAGQAQAQRQGRATTQSAQLEED
jgi:hypothetical protein